MEFFTPPILTRGFGITFERWRSPLAYGAISILLGLMLCHSIYGPDIWYHLSWGRSLAFSGAFTPQLNVLLQQPIVANIYWLFQLVTYGVFSLGGAIGIGILFMLLWIFIAACWLVMTGAWKNQNFGPLLFLAFVLCAQLRGGRHAEGLRRKCEVAHPGPGRHGLFRVGHGLQLHRPPAP